MEYIICVPFGYLPGPVAFPGAFVERLAELASASPRYFTVDAHVEILTVLGVRIARVRRGHAVVHPRTGEIEELARTAALLLRFVRPVANTGLFGKDEALRTGDHVVLALHAVVEGVTIPRVLVGEVTVHAGTVRRRLWLLCKSE